MSTANLYDVDEEEVQHHGEEGAFHHIQVPKDSKKDLRACYGCGLVKTYENYLDVGCENCPHLDMRDNPDAVEDCTSATYDGLIASYQPKESWVARWSRIERCLPGVYAMAVYGDPPEEVLEIMEHAGRPYQPRRPN